MGPPVLFEATRAWEVPRGYPTGTFLDAASDEVFCNDGSETLCFSGSVGPSGGSPSDDAPPRQRAGSHAQLPDAGAKPLRLGGAYALRRHSRGPLGHLHFLDLPSTVEDCGRLGSHFVASTMMVSNMLSRRGRAPAMSVPLEDRPLVGQGHSGVGEQFGVVPEQDRWGTSSIAQTSSSDSPDLGSTKTSNSACSRSCIKAEP
jgi:hypothetical protein